MRDNLALSDPNPTKQMSDLHPLRRRLLACLLLGSCDALVEFIHIHRTFPFLFRFLFLFLFLIRLRICFDRYRHVLEYFETPISFFTAPRNERGVHGHMCGHGWNLSVVWDLRLLRRRVDLAFFGCCLCCLCLFFFCICICCCCCFCSLFLLLIAITSSKSVS